MYSIARFSALIAILAIATSSNAISLIQTSNNLSNRPLSTEYSSSFDGELNPILVEDMSVPSTFQLQLVPTESTGWIWIYQIEGQSDFDQISAATSAPGPEVSSETLIFTSSGDILEPIYTIGSGTQEQGGGPVMSPVPEPGTFIAFGFGLLLMGLVISRKYRTQSAT